MTGNRGLALVLAGLALGPGLAGSALAASPLQAPDSLAQPARELGDGLSALARADTIDEARGLHDERVQGPAATMRPLAGDLADRRGRLLVSYLDQLEDQLARGNLSDARSLAGAAANVVEEDVEPAASRWDENRTALGLGPVRWQGDTPTVSLVLVNPPPNGIGAFAATIHLDEPALPTSARLTLGQGHTQVDQANRTARAASFDAQALAGLHGDQRATKALAEVDLDLASLEPGDNLTANVTVDEAATSQGDELIVVGLAGSRQVPPPGSGGGLPTGWLALGGAGLAAGGLVLAARRWEV